MAAPQGRAQLPQQGGGQVMRQRLMTRINMARSFHNHYPHHQDCIQRFLSQFDDERMNDNKYCK